MITYVYAICVTPFLSSERRSVLDSPQQFRAVVLPAVEERRLVEYGAAEDVVHAESFGHRWRRQSVGGVEEPVVVRRRRVLAGEAAHSSWRPQHASQELW